MTRQAEITQWAEGFGEVTDERLAARINEEVAELYAAVASRACAHDIAVECADVYIVACRLASKWDVDLDAAFAPVDNADVPTFAGMTDDAVHGTAMRIACSIVAFMSSVLYAMSSGFGDTSRALRDLVAVARNLCCMLDEDFDAIVAAKMVKNRLRAWRLDGSGCAYHIVATVEGLALARVLGVPGGYTRTADLGAVRIAATDIVDEMDGMRWGASLVDAKRPGQTDLQALDAAVAAAVEGNAYARGWRDAAAKWFVYVERLHAAIDDMEGCDEWDGLPADKRDGLTAVVDMDTPPLEA